MTGSFIDNQLRAGLTSGLPEYGYFLNQLRRKIARGEPYTRHWKAKERKLTELKAALNVGT